MTETDADDTRTESTEAMLARVRASFDRQGMMTTLGVEVIAVEPGRVEMSLRHDDRFTQQHGFLHAGAVASVLDTACGYAAYSVMPPEASVLTVTYTINLLAPRPASGSRSPARWSGRAARWWSAAARRSPTSASGRSRSCRPP